MTLLVRELSVLYPAFVAGRGSPLGELPIQYADFAVWQRSRLEGDSLASLLAYWSGQLRDLPVLQLPTDRPRPAVQGFRGGTHRLVVDAGVVAGLRSVGQQEGATLFMTLLAGFAALLHRYGGQDDLAIGAPIAGRTRAETEELIGFFVNTLVLRVDAGGDPSFRELVRRVRAVALGAYAHQDLPFEMLVERLQPERDLSRNPLFQVLFQLQASSTPRPTCGDGAAGARDHPRHSQIRPHDRPAGSPTGSRDAARATSSTAPICSTRRRSSGWRVI